MTVGPQLTEVVVLIRDASALNVAMVLVVAVADKVGWIRGIDSVRQRVVVEIIVLDEQTRRGLGRTVLGVGKDTVAAVANFAATHREIMRPFNVDAASKAVPKMLHARFVG